MLELAQLQENDTKKVQEYIQHICVASERAKELVRQILTFSRQGKAQKLPTDIGSTIKEALKLLRATISSTIEIKDNIATNLGVVDANQTQIHQIVMNLCTNSAHALRAGGGKVVVELFPCQIGPENLAKYQDIIPGRYLKLIIADNGHGMEPGILSRIFEPYFTTKDFGQGTGMGLATVHGIVKDHGGDIKVYSEPDVGTTVHILFPVADDPTVSLGETANILPRGIERILFVDDERFLVDIGKELLTNLGYSVATKTNSLECLAAFRARPNEYDLIITDYSMPFMDGEKLIMEIRKIRESIPVIFCTGFNKSILPKTIKSLEIDSVLIKPIATHELAIAVRQSLDARSAIGHQKTQG